MNTKLPTPNQLSHARSALVVPWLMLACSVASAQNQRIDWSNVSGGGGISTGGVYAVGGFIGRSETGPMSGGTFVLSGGISGVMTTTAQFDTVGDGIPDSWRAQYFPNVDPTGTTTNYLSCATCDADGTGQNNLFKYVAGLVPTNSASVFVLQIQNVPNQPTHKNLIYGPITSGCTYGVQSTTDLVAGVWSPQAVSAPLTNGFQVTVTDPNATVPCKFYRIDIYNIITNINIVVQDSVGDGIPDSWRAQYFPSVPSNTTNNQSCATCDADGTGQNNLFKYVAGLDPTNPASVFILQIASVNGQPSQKNLTYNPIASGRTYTVESRTNLLTGSYAALGSLGGPTTNVNQVTVTDLAATQTSKFYRVHISLP